MRKNKDLTPGDLAGATPAQAAALRAYLLTGSTRAAAAKLGINERSVREHLAAIRRRWPGDAAPRPAPASTKPQPDPVEETAAAARLSACKKTSKQLAKRVLALEGQLAAISAAQSCPLPPIKIPPISAGAKRPGTAVALLSDVHYGEVVEPHSTPYDASYSVAIAEARLKRFFAGLRWLVESEREKFEIHHLVLWFGGDMIGGHIHDELAESSLAAIPSIVGIKPLLIAGVKHLQEADLDISLVCSWGNHGRDTQKIRHATGAEHNHEWGMYQTLSADLPGVNVLASKGSHQYLEVYDRVLHFHHGHEVRYSGGVGGISIPINKAVANWQRTRAADYHHFGHYHQYVDYGHWVVNGSLKGFDAFAMSLKAAPEPAQQAFYVLDAKRGRTARSPIWVEDREAEKLLAS